MKKVEKVVIGRLRDEELIQSILRGNGEQYAWIVDRYQALLYRTAYYYTQNVEDARDITQEIFIKVYNNLAGFKSCSTFSTWLYRIAVNQCLDWRRKNKPHLKIGDCNEGNCLDLKNAEGNPEELFLRREMVAKIQQAVVSLPEKYSSILILYFFEDFSPLQIAQILDIPKRTVETRLYRGRKMLRERINAMVNGGEHNVLPSKPGQLAQLRSK